jgi:hypothetical protein
MRLIVHATPEACCAFERWAVPPRVGNVIWEVGGAFLLAHIGLAKTRKAPLAYELRADGNSDEASWNTWGEVIFWMHMPGISEATVREACKPLWDRLRGPLLLASIDPWWYIERYMSFRRAPVGGWRSFSSLFASELKTLLEAGLARRKELTSLIGMLPDTADRRTRFLIEKLEMIGDERSVLQLETLVDSDQFGRSAVRAIRAIRQKKLRSS